jgi:hypothetical protein
MSNGNYSDTIAPDDLLSELAELKRRLARFEGEDRDADNISGFCARNGISKAHYYNLRKAGRGPREMRLGSRVLITRDAGRDWRREREAESGAAIDTLRHRGKDRADPADIAGRSGLTTGGGRVPLK